MFPAAHRFCPALLNTAGLQVHVTILSNLSSVQLDSEYSELGALQISQKIESNFYLKYSEHGDVSLGDSNREKMKSRMKGLLLIDG